MASGAIQLEAEAPDAVGQLTINVAVSPEIVFDCAAMAIATSVGWPSAARFSPDSPIIRSTMSHPRQWAVPWWFGSGTRLRRLDPSEPQHVYDVPVGEGDSQNPAGVRGRPFRLDA